ncbi:MAG TPA: ATP-binding protein [Candidatus Obscuribacterales bacterium]
MRQFPFFSLRTKLILAFLGVALVPLLLLSWLNKHTAQVTLTNNANQALYTAASQTALSLDAFITANLEAVRVDAQLPDLAQYLSLPAKQRANSEAEAEVNATLRILTRRDSLNILSYTLFDRQGRSVLGTNLTTVGRNQAQDDYVRQPLQTGFPYASPLRLGSDKFFSIYFSSAVRNAKGTVVGVLAARYNTAAIQQLVSQNNGLAGAQSFAILLDENHIRLAHGIAPDLVFKSIVPLPEEKVKALIQADRLPPRPIAELTTNLPAFERGLNQITCKAVRSCPPTYFTTELAAVGHQISAAAVVRLRTQPWFVVFAQPQRVFLAPIYAQVQVAQRLAILIAIAVVIMAIAMAQWLAKPLVHLAQRVAQFTAGQLNARVQINSKDEIGSLATNFNAMAEQVGKLLQGLEERTQELEANQHVTFAVSELSKAILDPELLLQEAVTLLQTRFNLHHVQIYLLDDTTQQLSRQAGASGADVDWPTHREISIPLDCPDSLVARAARSQKLVVAESRLQEAGSERNVLLLPMGAEVAVPLIARGHLLGILDIQDAYTNHFSAIDLDTFKTLAGQIAIALENARLFGQIQKTEERFRRIFEDAPIGMAIASLEDEQLVQVNKAFCKMLMYEADDLTQLSFQAITHPADLNTDLRFFEQMVTGAIVSYQIEKRYLKQTQEVVWANLTATLIRDQQGGARYSLGMIENITERKRAEAALRQSEAQYREKVQELQQALHDLQQTQAQLVQSEKMSSLGQLVAGVAHEINNPINFIYGNLTHAKQYLQDLFELLSLYQSHYPHPAPAIAATVQEIDLEFLVEDFNRILASMQIGTERIRQIVLSLRNFSRLDEAEMKPVDIHQGIDNTLVILQSQLKPRPGYLGIEVVKEYGQLPLVNCYAGQLNQVFMNLLTNAIDALESRCKNESGDSSALNAPNQSPTISVSTTVVEPDQVLIRIVDNGPGMTETTRQRLFDPFFTTKAVGKGTGLGLSISYQIVVEKHQGQLHCLSSPGAGAEFIVQIPIQQRSKTNR